MRLRGCFEENRFFQFPNAIRCDGIPEEDRKAISPCFQQCPAFNELLVISRQDIDVQAAAANVPPKAGF